MFLKSNERNCSFGYFLILKPFRNLRLIPSFTETKYRSELSFLIENDSLIYFLHISAPFCSTIIIKIFRMLLHQFSF